MLARAIKAGVRIEWLESTDAIATLRLTRDGVEHEETWTIEGARKAGLAGKSGPWQTYPKAMLRARPATGMRRRVLLARPLFPRQQRPR
jgi:hypothetical protein